MQRASIGILLSLALILITANSIWGSRELPKADNRFEGKILTVYLKGAAFGAGSVVKNAAVEDIAGVKMLVGVVVAHDEQDEAKDLEIYIPWDNVASLYSMTPEQAAEAKAKYDNNKS